MAQFICPIGNLELDFNGQLFIARIVIMKTSKLHGADKWSQ